MPSCAWQEDGVAAMQHLQVGHSHTTSAEPACDSSVCYVLWMGSCEAVCMHVCLSVHTRVWWS